MASVVIDLKSQLEKRGEYVVLANISSGWFAINPRTWKIRSEQAARDGRNGPNLIVYRTTSGDPRDHHVVPYLVIRKLLTKDTLKPQVNGSQRWNLTLKNGKLHVTHFDGSVDVRKYHGVPVIVEVADPSPLGQLPPLVLDDSAAPGILEGIARETTIISRSRSGKLRDSALKRSKGICEACGTDFSALFGGVGLHALQVHHKKQLALQDVPTITGPNDLAVVCANCHAIVHADPKRALPVELLRSQWASERFAAHSLSPSGKLN